MEKNVTYNFKKRLHAGETVFGQVIGPGNDPEKTVKALKDFGFDFIMMECEHSLLNKETIFEYIRVSRKLDVPILLRPEEKTAHFLLVTLWDSIDSVKKFAGDNPETAKYYPEDDNFLLEKEEYVSMYDVFYEM